MTVIAVRLTLGCAGRAASVHRHRLFGIAGDRHGRPLRVFAPQRRERCMGKGLRMICL